jgi:hypothetical protein
VGMGWGGGEGQVSTLAKTGGGLYLCCSFAYFGQFHTMQLFKTEGYLFAMENIYHLVFIRGESNQGKRIY